MTNDNEREYDWFGLNSQDNQSYKFKSSYKQNNRDLVKNTIETWQLPRPKDNLLSIEASTIFNTLLFYCLCPLSFFFMVGKYWEREEMRFKARTAGTIECLYYWIITWTHYTYLCCTLFYKFKREEKFERRKISAFELRLLNSTSFWWWVKNLHDLNDIKPETEL